VNPQRRAAPYLGREHSIPQRQNRLAVDDAPEPFDIAMQKRGSLAQGYASPWVARSVRRRRAMQRQEKRSERVHEGVHVECGDVERLIS
jgi:hypothetical protein